MSPPSTPVTRAIDALKTGGFVLLYDADGREQETDLVVASEFVTPSSIRVLRTSGGGLICTTLAPQLHQDLGLPYLSDVFAQAGRANPLLARLADGVVPYERGASKPSFTLSVNHRDTFTGITDNDRALTISRIAALARDHRQLARPALRERFGREFKAPGHVFLLNAKEGLVAARRGHTELSTALLEIAGLTPTATICEMMNGPSGRALPKQDALSYAEEQKVPFLTGADVVEAYESIHQPVAAATR